MKATGYFIARDLDNDGLIETFRDGNGKNQFGDTGYDTISSGWKNAIVNGQAYKSFLGVAKMMEDIGDTERAKDYRQRAVRLRKAYNKSFFPARKKPLSLVDWARRQETRLRQPAGPGEFRALRHR